MNIGETRHRSNDITSGILHLAGVLLAISVLTVLLVVGAREGSAWHVVGYSLYAAGLILLYVSSALYHLVPKNMPRLKRVAQRLDHAMIYVLIAATYTPITFVALSGGWRWSMFGIIWGLACIGTAINLLQVRVPRVLPVVLCAVMGWLIVIASRPLIEGMDTATISLLIFGGLSYTLGILFFGLERVLKPRKYFWMHEIFHVCVLGGSALHSIVMFRIV